MSRNLNDLFSPETIAVVGASRNEAKLGHKLLNNVIEAGFSGDLVPINPAGGEILGREVKKSLMEIGKPIDLCLISIPNEHVVSAVSEAAAANVRTAVVLSSGFGEAGEAGRAMQAELAAILEDTQMRLIGPNCMGLIDRHHALNASYFWDIQTEPGDISFVSQSGAYGGILFREIAARGLGLAKFASIGNQLNVEHADLLEVLADDDDTRVIALFVEQIKDGTRFIEAAARAAAHKPVIALKAGRTDAGHRAALSHTGSMAGTFDIYRAAMKKAGVLLFTDTDAFFDAAAVLSHSGSALPTNDAVAILTISGGPSVAAADRAEEIGLHVPPLSDALQEKLCGLIPAFGAAGNPVDMTPQIDPAQYGACVREVYAAGEVGGVIAINVGLDSVEFGEAFARAQVETGLPTVSFVVDAPLIAASFARQKIPNFPTPERAISAYKALTDYRRVHESFSKPCTSRVAPTRSRALTQAISIAAPLPPGRPYAFDEHLSKQILAEYGIEIVEEKLVENIKEAVDCARFIGYPVALKICVPGIVHKTDADGLALNLHNEKELREAFRVMEDRFGTGRQYVIQRMLAPGREILIGGGHDEVFGKTITVGIGGTLTEIIHDTVTRICPISDIEAEEMLQELRGSQIFGEFRGKPPVQRKRVIDALTNLSDLLMGNERILEIDVNPVIVTEEDLIAVDALVVIEN